MSEIETIKVKSLIVRLIDSSSANSFVRRHHYSKKIVNNSCLHFGVLHQDRLVGALSFGPPMDKNKAIKLVSDTKWGEMLELNRMALSPSLPKNSESRVLGIGLRMLKQKFPHVKWVQTYADATQCGDGAIYRAVGFLLVNIKKNNSIRRLESGRTVARKSLDHHRVGGKYLSSLINSTPLDGFQIKYVYFLDPTYRQRLQCPIIPFSKIRELGATMIKGKRVSSLDNEALAHPG